MVKRYESNGIEVDCIQGAQIALYNAFVHDMYDYDEIASQEMDSLTDYGVILNVGTDASEIVVTNGVGVWLRNIPVGGNLFTKALTKQMKLTFSNAEHIKRNTETAQDPKAVLVAMKTVFNDMLTEVDRSLLLPQPQQAGEDSARLRARQRDEAARLASVSREELGSRIRRPDSVS